MSKLVSEDRHRHMPMGVDLHQKVGDQIGKLLVPKKNYFLKPSKTSKVQILGVLVVFICPAIYSTNQI